MKKLLFGMAIAAVAASCIQTSVIRGSGHQAQGAFDVSTNYTSLSVSSGITVELVHSDTGEGFITADEEVLEHVSIVEEGGRVKVSYVPFISVHSDVKTVVTMPLSSALERIEASAAGRVTSARRLLPTSMRVDVSSAAEVEVDMDAQELFLDLTGGASFDGNVVAQNLEVKMNSAAKCDIEGSADYCNAKSGSGSNFRGFALVCRKAVADASNGGTVEISATEELDARASGGGAVRYKGTPAIVKHDTSSGGSIREIR